jgi:hypothetical protein
MSRFGRLLTYEFDETLGTFRRGSGSSGPLFGERALTIGRHRWDAGMNVQFTSYESFEGRRLDDESIAFYLRHEDCCTVVLLPVPPGFDLTLEPNGTRLNPPLEGDLIEAKPSLDASSQNDGLLRQLRRDRSLGRGRGRAVRARHPGCHSPRACAPIGHGRGATHAHVQSRQSRCGATRPT